MDDKQLDAIIEASFTESMTIRPSSYGMGGHKTGDRVELHPGMDLWMQGARYGTVTGTHKSGKFRVKLDRVNHTVKVGADRLRPID